jgi:hypothetical protein
LAISGETSKSLNERSKREQKASLNMTHPHSTSAHSSDTLTDAELHELHAADKEAGRNIVVLMTGVFLAGLIGYSIVAMIVAR